MSLQFESGGKVIMRSCRALGCRVVLTEQQPSLCVLHTLSLRPSALRLCGEIEESGADLADVLAAREHLFSDLNRFVAASRAESVRPWTIRG